MNVKSIIHIGIGLMLMLLGLDNQNLAFYWQLSIILGFIFIVVGGSEYEKGKLDV